MHWLVPIIQAEIEETDSVLDLCCGQGLVMRDVTCALYMGIDIDGRQLERYGDEPHRGPSIYMVADVTQIVPRCFEPRFDVVVCVDGIEHLEPGDAVDFLTHMPHWARKSIIVTPDQFFDNSVNDITGKPQESEYRIHKSLTTEEDFVARGFTVKLKQPEVAGYNCMVYVKEN